MKTRLTHVRANVKNLQKSIEWYENVIGFIVDDWLPIDSLDKYTVFPRFFTTELLNLPVSMKNIVEIQNR